MNVIKKWSTVVLTAALITSPLALSAQETPEQANGVETTNGANPAGNGMAHSTMSTGLANGIGLGTIILVTGIALVVANNGDSCHAHCH